ncbi:hypothetical protein PCIT_a3264 [Pseudoalteromonas citrea]|uniref:Periplasmic binding protein domain-containing protein n=2 Tax=Pseudoalteromonas citrea TaxID=43655 RepID=A0AAD4AGN8_9GAMM|nr:substrate-binding domain-containing protein [Pseudoalteromonas citrea]KAF7768769.1 hypothetical protein PCIT_a3264 [Pseudoalteromonas citrea]
MLVVFNRVNAQVSMPVINTEKSRLAEGTQTAALAWHSSSPWTDAVTRGALDTFERFDIDVIAITDAQYDPVKQLADLESINALRPSFVLSLSVDSVSTASGYRQLLEAGTKLVLLSNPILSIQEHKHFAGLISVNTQAMGRSAAQLIDRAVVHTGNVGVIFHEADYYVTNQRDKAFLDALKTYQDITVVAKKGFVQEQDTSAVTMAMLLKQPNIDAIYVSWEKAAEGVIEALRMMGRDNVKVVSHDLGVSTLLDMAQGGNMYAVVSDRPYDVGTAMAMRAINSQRGITNPLLKPIEYDLVTKDNLEAVWPLAFRSNLPRALQCVLSHKEVCE